MAPNALSSSGAAAISGPPVRVPPLALAQTLPSNLSIDSVSERVSVTSRPLTPGRGHRMLAAAAAAELGMEARNGVRTDGSRRAGSLSARGNHGLSLDLDGPRRNSNARRSLGGYGPSSGMPRDLMASGPQTLLVASARGPRRGVHAGPNLAALAPHEREDQELRAICEQIGLKAAQKFGTVREAFRYLDADHDGSISKSEMEYFFRAYNYPNSTADRFFNKLDKDGSGFVDYQEFMKFVAPYVQPEQFYTPGPSECCSPDSSSVVSTRVPSPLGGVSNATGGNVASIAGGVTQEALGKELTDVLKFIGHKAPEKFYHARDVFRYVDSNGDGQISQGEIRWFFRAFNLAEASADEFFKRFASSGGVDYFKFVQILGPYLDLPGVQALMQQRPDEIELPSLLSSRAPSLKSSRAPSLKSSQAPSVATRASEALDLVMTTGTTTPRVLTPAQQEKEMRQVMRDIAEKLPLKFPHPRDAFRSLDLSHDGHVTRTEMRGFLRGFGWDSDVADRIFESLRDSDTGMVDYNAFMSHFEVLLGPANMPPCRSELVQTLASAREPELRKQVNEIAAILGEKLLTKYSSAKSAFSTLDLTNDGEITLQEMRMFFRAMSMPLDSANKVFRALRKDGSETVHYNDFLSLFGPLTLPGGRWRAVEDLKGASRSPQIWRIM